MYPVIPSDEIAPTMCTVGGIASLLQAKSLVVSLALVARPGWQRAVGLAGHFLVGSVVTCDLLR